MASPNDRINRLEKAWRAFGVAKEVLSDDELKARVDALEARLAALEAKCAECDKKDWR